MNYRLLGKSGLRVSEISLGTMTLGHNAWGWGATPEDSLEILKSYAEAGGNFIDTACNYQNGQSESIIGEFMKGDRDRYVVATKYTLRDHRYPDDPNNGGNHRKNLMRTVYDSLERLDTKYIDVLYLHMWDGTTGLEEVMKSLNSLVDSGKVNYIAISDTPAWVVARANTIAEFRGYEPFTAYQFPYSLISRDPENEIMPFSQQMDLAMTTWSTLGAGLLTGKYTRGTGAEGRLTEGKWGAPNVERLALARKVDEIADEIGVSSSQVAIRWAMQQKGVVIPIIGATKVAQMEENMHAADITLNDDQISQLNDVSNFKPGFPRSMIDSENVKNLIHGKTYAKLDDHRGSPYF